MSEEAYILGTDPAELYRLGLQHQVWAIETRASWLRGGFTAGHHILDLGSGPGFCSRELAFITGNKGSVTAVDRSETYIQQLRSIAELEHLPIKAVASTFDEMQLAQDHFDGVYCRWALAWVPNPAEVLAKVYRALKPGGRMVIHEYYDWTTHQSEPSLPALAHATAACYRSFKEQEGDIDIGRFLPRMLADLGMKILSASPLAKMARPHELTWQWPSSFYRIYYPKLVEMGYLSPEECTQALMDLEHLEADPNATINTPLVVEVIAEK